MKKITTMVIKALSVWVLSSVIGGSALIHAYEITGAEVTSLEITQDEFGLNYVSIGVNQTVQVGTHCPNPELMLLYDGTNSPAPFFYATLLTAKSIGALVDIVYQPNCIFAACEDRCRISTVKLHAP